MYMLYTLIFFFLGGGGGWGGQMSNIFFESGGKCPPLLIIRGENVLIYHFSLGANVRGGKCPTLSLRNSNDLQSIHARTALYSNSFLPSTVRDWNNLTPEASKIDTVNTFKQFLNRERECVPKYFYRGNRRRQMLHTRLRTNCSGLNNDLFLKT